jgi:hypothetical protein
MSSTAAIDVSIEPIVLFSNGQCHIVSIRHIVPAEAWFGRILVCSTGRGKLEFDIMNKVICIFWKSGFWRSAFSNKGM